MNTKTKEDYDAALIAGRITAEDYMRTFRPTFLAFPSAHPEVWDGRVVIVINEVEDEKTDPI